MRCCVPNCLNDNHVKICGKKITFHFFPRAPLQLKAWVEALDMSDYQLTDRSMVCSEHFRDEHLYVNKSGQTRLVYGAAPYKKGGNPDQEEINENEEPAAYKVCRICLIRNTKLYNIYENDLAGKYESLVGIASVTSNLRYPQVVCGPCASLLTAALHLKHKAIESSWIFEKVLETEPYIKVNDLFPKKRKDHSKNILNNILIEDSAKTKVHSEKTHTISVEEIEEDSDIIKLNPTEIDLTAENDTKFDDEDIENRPQEESKIVFARKQNPIQEFCKIYKTNQDLKEQAKINKPNEECNEQAKMTKPNQEERAKINKRIREKQAKMNKPSQEFTEQAKINKPNVEMLSKNEKNIVRPHTDFVFAKNYDEYKNFALDDEDTQSLDGLVIDEGDDEQEMVIDENKHDEEEHHSGEDEHNTEEEVIKTVENESKGEEKHESVKVRRRIDDETKNQIISLMSKGTHITQVCKMLNISRGTVKLWWDRWCKEGTTLRHSRRRKPYDYHGTFQKFYTDDMTVKEMEVLGDSTSTVLMRLKENGLRIEPVPKRTESHTYPEPRPKGTPTNEDAKAKDLDAATLTKLCLDAYRQADVQPVTKPNLKRCTKLLELLNRPTNF